MPYEAITLEKRQRVAFITLAKAETGNAIDSQMAAELRQASCEVQTDPSTWVVVLQAQGEFFCRGSQFTPIEINHPNLQQEMREALKAHQVASAIASITKPVIASLQGDALDQGLELALACDMRVAAVGIHLGFPQAAHDIMPWDGGTQRLTRLAGVSRAMDLLLTGRQIDTDESHALGLINQIANLEDLSMRVETIASTIAQGAPIASQYTKEAVTHGLDLPLNAGLRLEADLNFLLFDTADRMEGVRSFLEKRTPEYQGS